MSQAPVPTQTDPAPQRSRKTGGLFEHARHPHFWVGFLGQVALLALPVLTFGVLTPSVSSEMSVLIGTVWTIVMVAAPIVTYKRWPKLTAGIMAAWALAFVLTLLAGCFVVAMCSWMSVVM
jgi:hypothetical protein